MNQEMQLCMPDVGLKDSDRVVFEAKIRSTHGGLNLESDY